MAGQGQTTAVSVGPLFEDFKFMKKGNDMHENGDDLGAGLTSAQKRAQLEDSDAENLDVNGYEETPGKSRGGKRYKRDEDAREAAQSRAAIVVSDESGDGGERVVESDDSDEEVSPDDALFSLPVMRNALEMSRLLQNAAAGAQGQSGDALRVGLTEMRTDLSADAGVLSLDDIVAACGPSVGALKPYQVVGVSFLTLLYKNDIPGAILADEMGLGKTVQLISFLGVIRTLFQDIGPHIVVCPVSLLENWEREIKWWCPSLEVSVLYGGKKRQFEDDMEEYVAWKEDGGPATGDDPPFDIALVPYTIFERATARAERELINRVEWSHLIMDEAHAAKNRGSTRYKKLRRLAGRAKRRVLMTGTPLQNSLEELQALLELILPDVAEMVATVVARGEGDGVDDEVVGSIRRVLAPVLLRRLKDEVAEQLMAKRHYVDMVDMTERQRSVYEEASDKIRRRLLGDDTASESKSKAKTFDGIEIGVLQERVKKMESKEISNMFVHLRKIAYHPLLVRSLFSDETAMEIAGVAWQQGAFGETATRKIAEEHMMGMSDYAIHTMCKGYHALRKWALEAECVKESGKVQHMLKLFQQLREKGSRVLIFSQWTTVLDIIADVLELEGLHFLRLDGSTAGQERQSLCDRFNAPGSPIFAFLLTTRAGGVGLNLTGADTVILHDVDFNPQIDRQAEDRAHRLGQEKPVHVYRLISAGTVDEKIHEISQQKLRLNDAVLEDGQRKSGKEGEGGEGGGSTRMMGDVLAAILSKGDA